MEKLSESLLKLLKTDSRYFTDEGNLLKNAVYEDAMRMDSALIKLLLSDKTTRARFFAEVDGVLIFDKVGFGWVINNRSFLPGSYTRYKNKIGLTDENGDFISENNKVVLNFPYKDCILEGGQTKEDQKRDEIFYNAMLAPEEVDRLLYPKVFTGAKRYGKNGIERNITFEEGDNLVIKGNNLLALASLLERFEGQVKCIYIDIPYNTGNDSFGYNDNFNHSTWLTFIKNRLSIAKRLLRDNGCIFIQCDDNEQAYLKVLCDEIFGRNNFVNCISVKMSEATGVKMSHAKIRFPKLKEYILFYKNDGVFEFEEIDKYEVREWDRENNIYLENFTRDMRNEIIAIDEKENKTQDDVNRVSAILKDVKKVSLSAKIKEEGITQSELNDWLFGNSYRIVKTCGSSSLYNSVKKIKALPEQDIACALSKEDVLFFFITDFNRDTAEPRLRVIFADENIYKNPCDFWQDIKTAGAIANEGGVRLTNGKKPEKILHRIIKMTTKPGDIILDFFSGSGTTGAVAHKMGRRYIMCEQLESHLSKQVERLVGVINGDLSGVSDIVGWQGGGSFVYCELSELNLKYADKIRAAENDPQLAEIWAEMQKSGFISSDINPKDINFEAEDFKELSCDDKKRLLTELLDKNMLYVNYCDIDDENFSVSDEDKIFTRSFYEGQ